MITARKGAALMIEVLVQRGAEVTLVENGAQAVEAGAPGRFDVLILDISMPVMDGITALARLCEIAEEAGVALAPSIAFTANAMAVKVVEYVAAGFDTHVAKPFRADDLARAILLASAKAATIGGLRSNMRSSQGFCGAPRRRAQRITAIAPVTSSRRMSRCPIFDVFPSLCFPPEECCRGTNPSHAAKSRPRRNCSIGGAKVSIASAVIGPTPGMVCNCRGMAVALDAAASFAETAVRRDVNSSICSRTMRQMSRARSGRPEPGSSTTFANRGMYRPFRRDVPEFIEVRAQGVDRLDPLLHDLLAGAKRHRPGLLVFGHGFDDPHGRTRRRLGDCFRVGGVVFLALDEQLGVMRRDQPDTVPVGGQLSCPVMGAWASLHRHVACGMVRHESRKLQARQFFAEHDRPVRCRSV